MSVLARVRGLRAEPHDFEPGILRLQAAPPSPLPRLLLYVLLALVATALFWAVFGRLDIVAVAQGRIVPQSYLQIVQPAESGIVKELLVREGDEVRAGQVLARMDKRFAEADKLTLENEVALKRLQLRRVDAELAGTSLAARQADPPELYAQVEAQFRARRQAYLDQLETERALLAKAEQDLKSAAEIEAKLSRSLPIAIEQEQSYERLAREGFANRLAYLEKSRERIEKEQDLKAQRFGIASLKASIEQARRRIAQIQSGYRQGLQNERVEVAAQHHRLLQELDKQTARFERLDLRAPQDGVVKDLGTHTVGTVLQPGTVLMTLVPINDPVQAEVWVTHEDAGFVVPRQPVKLKLAAYPFQKYGMVSGEVRRISPDASGMSDGRGDRRAGGGDAAGPASGYRALVALGKPYLEAEGRRYPLSPGMQLSAEINLGTRTVLEYLLSPVRRTLHEAARER